MQKIVPFLWFDDQAEEAVDFYASLFKDSRVGTVTRYDEAAAAVSGRPQGSVMTVAFELEGGEFVALNGGSVFHFTPAISFSVGCESEEEIDELWEKLSDGGTVLMELGAYPFSEKYGWLNDRYGVSWQLILGSREQKIVPSLLFVGGQYAKAEEAINFYASVFDHSDIDIIARYKEGEDRLAGTVKYAEFTLQGEKFIAMESGLEHQFTFTPAISFVVNCVTQEEVDELWERLSEEGETERCGWLKDKYGVSWQIVPTVLSELLSDPDPEKSKRVMQAMLRMKKLDIKALQQA